jgi:hypothetical protein
MRGKAWFVASVGLNLVLAGLLLFWARGNSRQTRPAPAASVITQTNPTKTHVVLRKQNFTWNEVESPDYLTYITNLRAIGCPEMTIRDIIVADVNQRFSHRRLSEVISAEHQWWRSEPDMDLIEAASAQLRELEAERRELLTRLLGPHWEQSTNPIPPPARTGVSLSGPVLGDLPPETKQTVYDLTAKIQQQIDAYVESRRQQGQEPDPLELARLRRQTRDEVSKILNAEQMEEFLLRYSETAHRMREELHGLDLTPDEFRALFQARDPIEQQFALRGAAEAADSAEVQRQRDAVLRQVLDQDKYIAYRLNQDPIFRHTRATIEELGAPARAVLPIYEINQVTEVERQRIRSDPSLTNEQKVEALSAVQADQLKSIERILGPEAFERYLAEQFLVPRL